MGIADKYARFANIVDIVIDQDSLALVLELQLARFATHGQGRHAIDQSSRVRSLTSQPRSGKLNSENEQYLVSFHANKAMSRGITHAMVSDEESIAAQQQ
ncbi:hypothetical protein E4U34_002939 [Claviceps purpurea]|nr:hypothetical protein E4U51_002711 [Claviceps purpurea]KAG6229378.1 hypothetical protein E4U34_002939 [Claviceps purpurea]KAG6252637.1 hypothetical protein E4U23_008569 [Claviceps purpurea]